MATNNSATRRMRRERRHLRVREARSTAPASVRVWSCFRSLNQMEGQVVDDVRGRHARRALDACQGTARAEGAGRADEDGRSRAAGKRLAERARELGITQVVFDRGGYIYHGRVKAFAEGAREGGLEF